MAGYTYLKRREDGDFDHVSVNTSTGVETVFAKVLAVDEQYPWGRPTDEETAEENRQTRNDYLEQTDVWVLSDRNPTQAQIDYRQALRDLPTHSNWPNLNAEDWPTRPS